MDHLAGQAGQNPGSSSSTAQVIVEEKYKQ